MWSWQRRVERAKELARADVQASQLLTQYAAILTAQAACFDALVARGERLTGSLERDLDELRPRAAEIFTAIAGVAPAQAIAGAPTDAPAIDALLADGWRQSAIPFLARTVLQPYAEALAVVAGSKDPAYSPRNPAYSPRDPAYSRRDPAYTFTDPARVRAARNFHIPPERAACPFCGGPPQVAVLRSDGAADGGGRALECATCSTSWPVRRILCANCGEEDERRLGYFQASPFEHVRVDACETCRHYIKTVDLTKLGRAVPLVDELAAGALDLWAQDRGYTKVTPNLIGL